MKRTGVALACIVVLTVGAVLGVAMSAADFGFTKAARVSGVVVGKDTIEDLEKRFGPGAPCMGGHYQGGRVWYVKSQNVYVYADGFDYNEKGRILDQLTLSKQPASYFADEVPRSKIPSIRVSKAKLGWMGKVVPGISKSYLLKQTADLPKPESENGSLTWKIHGTDNGEPVTLKIQADLKKDVLISLAVVTQ